MGSSTITVYNGLAIPVTVNVGGKEMTVASHAWRDVQFAKAGIYPITAHTASGKLIERFDGELSGSFGAFVYNVGGATPLVEWTAAYGNAQPKPQQVLGAPRWTRTSAQVLFDDPPESVDTESGGALRRVLSAASDAPPGHQLSLITDTAEQRALIETHARWDATTSEDILTWLAIAEQAAPESRRIVDTRLAETPNDVVLMRAAQDWSRGTAESDSVCTQHRASAAAAPDDANLYYVATRCMEESPAQAQAYIEGHARWPDNAWLAYAAGYSHAEAGQWTEAVEALEASRRTLRPVTKSVIVDVARIRRLIGDENDHAFAGLVKASQELQYVTSLETGKGLEKSPDGAYAPLMRGELDKAIEIAHADSMVEANVLRLAAASEGASPEIQARALALGVERGLDRDTRWASIGLAMRDGRDHVPFMPSEREMSPADAQRFLRFIERARAGGDPAAADEELRGLPPRARGHAYSVAVIVLGERAPQHWRTGAKRLLFPLERPYFK
jgi:hypothetical protein